VAAVPDASGVFELMCRYSFAVGRDTLPDGRKRYRVRTESDGPRQRLTAGLVDLDGR
jgi:hypothetical protein